MEVGPLPELSNTELQFRGELSQLLSKHTGSSGGVRTVSLVKHMGSGGLQLLVAFLGHTFLCITQVCLNVILSLPDIDF